MTYINNNSRKNINKWILMNFAKIYTVKPKSLNQFSFNLGLYVSRNKVVLFSKAHPKDTS